MPSNGSGARSTVFAIVPTFNRYAFTRTCIELLQAQTYGSVVVIVSDGGSTDGTRENIRRDFPNVRLVYDDQDRWWAGSTALGVEAAYETATDDDYLLLINNDTEIPLDYVATLVAASKRHGGAVGAKIVDSRDHTVVHDAGEFIEWHRYAFPVKSEVRPGETFCDTVDVLPGRGSLIPVPMMKRVGNVDAEAFPHYLADYDLFCRLKAAGCPLGVCYETYIAAHIEETGILPTIERRSFSATWDELFSRRSMTNVNDHCRFIDRHAPKEYRAAARQLVLDGARYRLFWASPLGRVAAPLERHMKRAHQALVRVTRKPAQFLYLPRPMTGEEIAAAGFNVADLLAAGALTETPAPGWYRTVPRPFASRQSLDALRVLDRAAAPLSVTKVKRLNSFRRALRAQTDGGEAGAPS